jgi:hypothetical protein
MTVNSAPPRPHDHTYPGLPDAGSGPSAPPAARPAGRRIGFLVAIPLLAAGIGFGLVATVIALNRPAPTPAPPASKPGPVLVVKGSGTKQTRVFTTGTDWTLQYSVGCPLVVVEYTGTHHATIVDTTGSAQDEVRRRGDAGRHYLEVRSTCSWALTAIG